MAETIIDLDDDWEEWDPRKGSFLHHMIAGSAAGVAEHLAMFPFDTYKTHVQFSRERGSGESFLSLLRREGVRRLYRGAPAVLASCIPSHAAYFSVYEAAKEALGANEPGYHPAASAASGALATVLHDAVLTPFDVVKQRLQLGFYSGVTDCLRTIVKEEGFRALYRSYPMTLLMNMPYAAAVVASNEGLKTLLGADRYPTMWKFMLAGAGAGALAAAITCPLDVVKTRLQTAALASRVSGTSAGAAGTAASGTAAASAEIGRIAGRGVDNFRTTARSGWRSLFSAFQPVSRPQVAMLYTTPTSRQQLGAVGIARQILVEEGAGAFFKGMRARMTVHAPSMAVSWGTYELVKGLLMRTSGPGQSASMR